MEKGARSLHPVTVSILANAGVMIGWKDTKILVDALEDAGPYAFSKPPESVLAQMMAGQGKWANANNLIFSHEHPDHFTPKLIDQYRKQNAVHRMILPNGAEKETKTYLHRLKEERALYWLLPNQLGKRHAFLLQKDVMLHAMVTPHTGARFEQVGCALLLFEIEGRRILLLSDCSERRPEFYAWLRELSIDLALVNPFFFASLEGQSILKTDIQAKTTGIYHIPEPQDDQMQIRSVAKQGISKFHKDYDQLIFIEHNLFEVGNF